MIKLSKQFQNTKISKRAGRSEMRFRQEKVISLLRNVQNSFRALAPHIQRTPEALSSGDRPVRREDNRSHQSNTEITTECTYISTTLCVFTACRGTKLP